MRNALQCMDWLWQMWEAAAAAAVGCMGGLSQIGFQCCADVGCSSSKGVHGRTESDWECSAVQRLAVSGLGCRDVQGWTEPSLDGDDAIRLWRIARR